MPIFTQMGHESDKFNDGRICKWKSIQWEIRLRQYTPGRWRPLQRTWLYSIDRRANYRYYGQALGVDLETNPRVQVI